MIAGIDASRAFLSTGSGVARYSRCLIEALVAHSEHVFRLYTNGVAQPSSLQFPNVHWRNIPFPRLWTHIRLSAEMILHRPQVLFVPAHVLPLVRPRATVVTIHDLGYLYYPKCHPPTQRLYLHLSTIWNARLSTVILADSHATAEDLQAKLEVPASKIIVAYPGVSTQFKPQPLERVEAVRRYYQLPPRYLLYVGTIQPRKNIARLVAAHAQVQEAPPLVIAGAQGWLAHQLSELLARDPSRVRVLGDVPDSVLPPLMAGADALLLPSLYEGFGLPALEAIACGTPPVVSCTSSLPEVVGHAGLLVDPLSVDDIARAIRTISSNGALARELSKSGIARARSYSWAACATTALAAMERAYHESA